MNLWFHGNLLTTSSDFIAERRPRGTGSTAGDRNACGESGAAEARGGSESVVGQTGEGSESGVEEGAEETPSKEARKRKSDSGSGETESC